VEHKIENIVGSAIEDLQETTAWTTSTMKAKSSIIALLYLNFEPTNVWGYSSVVERPLCMRKVWSSILHISIWTGFIFTIFFPADL
jgi:hypothetical protein